MKQLYLLLFFFGWTHTLASSYILKPHSIQFNQNRGLPTNIIYEVKQDKFDFLWIAHEKGLSKFDGVQLTNYVPLDYSAKALSNIQIDANNTVYCQNFVGEIFKLENQKLLKLPVPNSGVYEPFILHHENLIIPKYNELVVYNTNTKISNSITLPIAINTVLKQNNNVLVIGNKINAGSVCYFLDESYNPIDSIQYNIVIQKVYESKGQIFFYANHTLYNQKGEPLITDITNRPNTVFFYESYLAIAQTDGLHIYQAKTFQKKGILFKKTTVSNVFENKWNELFITSLNQGFFKIINPDILEYTLPYEITQLYRLNKSLYAGTSENQLIAFDSLLNETLVYKNQSIHPVLNIASTANNSFLIASNDLKLVHNKQLKNTYNIAAKHSIVVEPGLWMIAFSHGAALIQQKTSTKNHWLYKYFTNQLYSNELSGYSKISRCNKVHFDSLNNRAILGLTSGAEILTPTNQIKLEYNEKPVIITDIIQVDSSVLIATISGELLALNSNNSLQDLLQNQSVRFETIRKVLKTDLGILFSTENEIYWLNNSNQLVNINTKFTIPLTDIRTFEHFNNKLYIAFENKLLALKLNAVNQEPKRNLKGYISKVLVNNKPVEPENLEQLASSQNTLEILFTIPYFNPSDNFKIGYAINQTDTVWLSNTARSFTLSKLAPGNYSISLVTNLNKHLPIASLSFSILAPFYSTWWFIASTFLLLASVVFLIIRKREQNLKLKNQLIEENLKLEKEVETNILSSIRAQMNPHFIFNALNTIQSYIYTNDKNKATAYLTKFSNLTRMILDLSNHQFISLTSELTALKLYLDLEQQRFQDNFTYYINIGKNLDTDAIQLPPMLIQPYVENAIKHGLLNITSNRVLRIEFQNNNNNYLEIKIDDNGVGRAYAEKLKAKSSNFASFSTQANQKRLQVLNNKNAHKIGVKYIDKTDNFNNALGTTVIITIPLNLVFNK